MGAGEKIGYSMEERRRIGEKRGHLKRKISVIPLELATFRGVMFTITCDRAFGAFV